MTALGATATSRSLVALGTTLFVATLALASIAHAQAPEANRFERKVLVGGIDEPIEIEFDRAGRVYFIERKGAVKRYDERTGRVDLLGHIPVARVGEAGLIGLLLDRDFDRTRQLYLYFSSAGTPSEMRLSRFTLTAQDSIDLRSEVVLMHWSYEVASHFGGGLTWDAQGNLYLTTGDNSEATQYNPVHWTNEGGKAQDSQRTSANSNDLRGKILRIHPQADGSYTIPSGNLFPPGTANTRPEIYTMGNRNPWRISIDSKNGFLHWGEVGPDAGIDSAGVGPKGYDEFNIASSAGNYGWPFFIGNRSYNTVDYGPPKTFGAPMDPAHPVNRSPNNSGLRDLPSARPAALAYPYGVSEEWPLLGSGGRCAVGGPIFHAANFTGARHFPDYYENKWFVADFVRAWVMVATMSDDHTKIVSMERFLPDEKVLSPIDMDFGPSGDLYIVEYGPNNDGRLSKIQYNAGNRAPKVVASADRTAGATPLRVSLSSKGTVDYDDDALRYRWIVTPATGTAREYPTANPTFTLSSPGAYTAVLTVTDRAGASSRDSVQLVAGNEPPRVAIDVTQGNHSFYFPDGRVGYRVRVSDREDGPAIRKRVTVTTDYVPSGMTPREIANARDLSPEISLRHIRANAIIARSDCVACHRTDTRLVGPALRAVAQKYAGQNVLEQLAQKIITGGKGVWGEVVMPPHPSLTPAEASTLAQYVLNLSSANARPQPLPLAGSYTTIEHRKPHAWDTTRTIVEQGAYILRATYTDNGANGVAPITSSSAALLRNPLVAPETADSISPGIIYNLSKGDPGFVIRRSGAHIAFRNIDLNGIGGISVGALTRFYTWSHFKGATIEIRLDSANGVLAGAPIRVIPPAAKADPVVLGNNLEKPVTVTLDGVSGTHDVFFVFTNADARPDDDLLLLTGMEFKAAAHDGGAGPSTSLGTTPARLPEGFTRLFNSRDLTGWHVSRTTHQGTTPDVRVEDGAIVLRQHPYGQGGLLMTDKAYENFELYLEVKPDSLTNGGIFLRSTEGGSAYQVELEGGGGGGTGSFFGEMLRVSTPVEAKGVQSVWRQNDWNAMRIRIVGDVPTVTLWINGTQIYEAKMGRNDLIGGRTSGVIALQSHWSATTAPVAGSFDMSGSWKPGATHRFRNIGIKVVPPEQAERASVGTNASRPIAGTGASKTGMEFVRIEPGSFVVGRFQPACPQRNERWTANDHAACTQMVKRDAMPGFSATITRPFYIGKFEVTQGEWKRVMGTNPSVFQRSTNGGNADRHPVDNVSWADAQVFVRKLNALDLTARYRLPTEFEWEYAARAGAAEEPRWDEIRATAWEQDVDLGTTHPAGGKKPNAWGLYDTLGNVWEWVSDNYNEKLFADAVAPKSARIHVLKGGSFLSDVKNATWSTHAGGPGSGFDVGFRVVREVP
ncbi:MAG: SUMF1/EgtB/PvdO family nonheme iron enzyme [Gemmatimonadaceae bacterium]